MAINDERQQIGQFQAHWELGHDEGLKEGRDEERINIARNCIAMGMDEASIAKVTGLSEAEIASMKETKVKTKKIGPHSSGPN